MHRTTCIKADLLTKMESEDASFWKKSQQQPKKKKPITYNLKPYKKKKRPATQLPLSLSRCWMDSRTYS